MQYIQGSNPFMRDKYDGSTIDNQVIEWVNNNLSASDKVLLQMIDALSEHPPLFQEFTGHGIGHISRVLTIVMHLIPNELITDDNTQLLSQNTIHVLLGGIIAHDIGMLVDIPCVVWLLEKEEWSNKYEEYRDDFRLLTAEDLVYKFGDKGAELVAPSLPVKADDVQNYKPVFGDFIRKYHHELSEFFVINGLLLNGNVFRPFANDSAIYGTTEIEMLGLVALLAKAHRDSKTTLRGILADLGRKWPTSVSIGTAMGIPMYYLIALLRMADALDATKERANHYESTFGRSALSTREHKFNQLFSMESWIWSVSAENLIISGNPRSTTQYIAAVKWVDDVQKELDTCWAVLSEKNNNSKLKYLLSIRSITAEFMPNPDGSTFYDDMFLTSDASIKIKPGIAKLFVGPLYSYNPRYGVRELIQNSVDSCSEREREERRCGEEYIPKIVIDVEIDNDHNQGSFTISDNGMGMNQRILLDHYLTVGSSYRDSNEWKKQFQTQQGDIEVIRSGRFGVGMLAGYLLGKDIEVSTRYRNEKKGYKFQVDVNGDCPDVWRTEEESIGTKIHIGNLGQKAMEYFVPSDGFSQPSILDWFYLDKPEINLVINGTEIQRSDLWPSFGDYTGKGWFEVDLGSDVIAYWRFREMNGNENAATSVTLCLNGLLVDNMTPSIISELFDSGRFDYPGPKKARAIDISIFDRNVELPISLDRTSMGDCEALEKLRVDICKFLLFKLLQVILTNDIIVSLPKEIRQSSRWYVRLEKTETRFGGYMTYLFSKKGYIPVASEFLKLSNLSAIYIVFSNTDVIDSVIEYMHNSDIAVLCANYRDSFPDTIDLCGYLYIRDDSYRSSSDESIKIMKYLFLGESSRQINSRYKALVEVIDISKDDPWIPYNTEEREAKFEQIFSRFG